MHCAALRAQLEQHVEAERTGEVPLQDVKPDTKLRKVLHRALTKSIVSNRKGVDGAELIVAMLVENDSYAATALRE